MTRFASLVATLLLLIPSVALADPSSTTSFQSQTLHMGLYEYDWDLPAGITPQATLVIIHGLKDYGQRYDRLAQGALAMGIQVRALDLPGHGRSPRWGGQEGKPDGYIPNIDLVAEAVYEYVSTLRQASPDMPIFVMGHSMGGTIVARAAELHDKDLGQGIILSAPALRLFTYQDFLFPGLQLVDWIDPKAPLFFGLNLKDFSSDPAVIEELSHDPFVFNGIHPTATAIAIGKAAGESTKTAPGVDIPVLVIHSAADHITNYKGSQSFVKAISSTDKTLEIIPKKLKLKHDLLHEPDGHGEQIQQIILSWLQARLPQSPAQASPTPSDAPTAANAHARPANRRLSGVGK